MTGCPDPGGLLDAHWGLRERPSYVPVGVIRWKWRVGERYWLSCCEAAQALQFKRETNLLIRLNGAVGAAVRSPEVAPTLSGQPVLEIAGRCWRVTTHVAGEEPDSCAAATYEASAMALAGVHQSFASLAHDSAVLPEGFVQQLPSQADGLRAAACNPATADLDEADLLLAAASVIERSLLLATLPEQVVHGDWTPGNLRVTDRTSPIVCGVLDFEFSRVAPVELDLAQLCSSLLMWSGFDRQTALDEMRKALTSYGSARGHRVDEQAVFACMAAYWSGNYLHWRKAFERSGSCRDVLERQPSRLRSVLSFLSVLV